MTLGDCTVYDVVRLPDGFVGYLVAFDPFYSAALVTNGSYGRTFPLTSPVERLQSACAVALAKVRASKEAV